MNEITKVLIIGIIVNIVSHILIRILDNIGLVNIEFLLEGIGVDVILFYIVIAILIFLIVLLLGKLYYKKLHSGPKIIGIRGRPNTIFTNFSIRRFGIDWKGVIGGRTFLDKPYAYIDGVFCPECGCELDRKIKAT